MRAACLTTTALVFLTVVNVLSEQRNTGVEDSASPFGLRMSMAKEELRDIQLDKGRPGLPYAFMLSSVPKPHPSFELYIVQVTPKAGLCRIFASTGTQIGSQLKT